MNNLTEKKIMICGGGTAGHIYPAISVIEYIKKNYSGCKILFIGTRRGMENKFIPGLNVDFKTIRSSGLIEKGKISKKILNYLKFLFLLITGFFGSAGIIIKFKPDFILGMGGYVCGPVLIAAIFLNKKYGLHEQNYIPGRLNKKFSKSARYIFTSFEETGKYFNASPGKIIFSGNPVRESIKNFKKGQPQYKKWGLDKDRFTIVAFGGSLGADKINNAVIELWDHFRRDEEIQILLICGQRFYHNINNKISGIYKSDDLSFIKILPYVSEMEEVYRIADLIISRS
ncbi:MAG: UDP-N-acetylglucosamine--N-acetylmuramyl-(pentapeptide) pyrophosphoryl-undecaprenol N-acetylglucosamine transferase, partial [Actinobacteria bacterium]|nr:UDP-N-acetylglucosamine--N-acetylmuramyl-(pentapeptide) pyrophosphoryl-undecaprenol N-acetylglucosamine transferase [Actinomycetota bacterium]